jgi:predicted Zn-dependent protease
MNKCGLLVLLLSASAFGSDITRGNQVDAVLRDDAPLYEDSQVCARVAEIGQKVVAASGNKRGFSYSFYVLNNSDVTAFSAPGGHVYVTTGLLRHLESEDELAAVLGHEIAHVEERHLMQTEMTQRAKERWQTILYATTELAAIAASVLVRNAIGESMNTYTAVPGPGVYVGAGRFHGSTVYIHVPNMIVLPQDAGGMQIAGIVRNAVAMGTARGGAMLLNAYYHGFKDQYEFDADRLGMKYAKAAGYDGASLVHVMERIGGTPAEIDSTGISHMHSSSKVLLQRAGVVAKSLP